MLKKIKRNTRLKNMSCYIQKMAKVAAVLKLDIDVFQVDSQNWILHVNVDLEIIIQGDEQSINEFETLIDKRTTVE